MCAHQSPHMDQRLILTNEANPKTKSTSQVENTNTRHLECELLLNERLVHLPECSQSHFSSYKLLKLSTLSIDIMYKLRSTNFNIIKHHFKPKVMIFMY